MSSSSIPMSWLHGSEDEKMVLSRQVSQIIRNGDNEKEQKIAEDIAKVLLSDLSQKVRETLASELRHCSTLSQDICHKIAIDVEEISCPFLEKSKVFSDEHLERLVPIVKEYARVSIAKREHVSQGVAVALVEFSSDETITVLMQNKGAEMGKEICDKMADRYEGSHPNMEMLASRIDLPEDLQLELVRKISSQYMEAIDEQYFTSGSITDHLNHWVSEHNINNVVGRRDKEEIEQQIARLHSIDMLTPIVILNNLQLGDVKFFEAAMAVLTKSPVENIHRLLSHGGLVGVERLLERANIPKSFFKKFKTALDKAYKK